MIAFLAGFSSSASRLGDQREHLGDVVAGVLLGIIVGILVCYNMGKITWKLDDKELWEQDKEMYKKSEESKPETKKKRFYRTIVAKLIE